MPLKNRLLKLEKASQPVVLTVTLLKFTSGKPLPEPVIRGGVRVVQRYADKKDGK